MLQQFRGPGASTPPDFWALWSSIRCPILIIRGVETDILEKSVAQKMCDTNANAKLAEIKDAAHMVYEENPEGFLAALRQWIAYC